MVVNGAMDNRAIRLWQYKHGPYRTSWCPYDEARAQDMAQAKDHAATLAWVHNTQDGRMLPYVRRDTHAHMQMHMTPHHRACPFLDVYVMWNAWINEPFPDVQLPSRTTPSRTFDATPSAAQVREQLFILGRRDVGATAKEEEEYALFDKAKRASIASRTAAWLTWTHSARASWPRLDS